MSIITKERPQEEQSQEQELGKCLTIDEIMPTWSEYFDLLVNKGKDVANYFEAKNGLGIASCDRCCVGESWKWTRKYANYTGNREERKRVCSTCNNFAYSWGENGINGFVYLHSDVIVGKAGKNWRESPTVKAFVEHFNRVHVK